MVRASIAAGLLAVGLVVPAAAQTDIAAQKSADAGGVLLRGNAQQALALFTEALKDPALTNDRRASLLNDRGVAYLRLGQHRAAIDDFNRAAQLFPEHAPIYNNRGNTLLALGLAREAGKDFNRAILLAPGYATAYNNRASAFLQLGQTAEAIRDFSKAIELMPANAAPLSGRGRALLSQDRPYAAMRDFSRALQMDARFASGYRARAEAKLAVERYEDAVEDLSRAAAFEPGNAEILVLRGSAYLMARNAASAIKDFSRAIELEPRSVAAFLGRGLAYAKAEAFDEAETDLARALELDPRSAVAFAYRAIVYKQIGQPDLGQKELEKAVKLDPSRAEVLWAMGEIDEAIGRNEDAVTRYRAALAARPGLREAADGLERLGAGQLIAETDVAGLGTDRWRVVTRSGRYFAINSQYPRLRVPLEMIGEGQPLLLEWDLKRGVHKGIGVLRFASGTAPTGSGTETVEQIAIIDVQESTVLGINLHRHGDKQSQWTWEDGRIVVASYDGMTDEMQLRRAKSLDKDLTPAPVPRRVVASDAPRPSGAPSWAPWAQSTWGGSPYDTRPRTSASPRPAKPKTLFDLLFGN